MRNDTYKLSFFKFVFRDQKKFVYIAIVITIAYFFVLRSLFPVPSFYADSFTWVGAAKYNDPVSFRPIGYSKFIQFFKLFSVSDIALIGGQYFSNVVANLFLFFTCIYFFAFTKVSKIVLFALLIVNPLYVFYCNYVYADAFFCSLAVLWFTLLIWLMYTSAYRYAVLQLAVIVMLFMLRSNAIIFPVIGSVAILLCKQSWVNKAGLILLNFFVIILVIFIVTKTTQRYTGTKVFSAFSGWQLANNAMSVLRYKHIDAAEINDKQIQQLVRYTQTFFDTTSYIPEDASSWYMWDSRSPLRKFINNLDRQQDGYFRKWNAVGPVYGKFGGTIILRYPVTYFKHFIVPNAKAYFFPALEVYDRYMGGLDTIGSVATQYYKYNSNKTPPDHRLICSIVYKPWQYIFPVINCLFLVLAGWFIVTKRYRLYTAVFNKSLLCVCLLYCVNFLFVVALAPTVLRYHIFILTLLFPFVLYMISRRREELKVFSLSTLSVYCMTD